MKIEKIIEGLLNKLEYLDYITITVKSSDNRVGAQVRFLYETISKLYDRDLKNRVLGMITNSDFGTSTALNTLQASGIELYSSF